MEPMTTTQKGVLLLVAAAACFIVGTVLIGWVNMDQLSESWSLPAAGLWLASFPLALAGLVVTIVGAVTKPQVRA